MEGFVKFKEDSRKRRQLKRFQSLVFQRQLQLSDVRIKRVVSRRRLFAKSKYQDYASFNARPIPPWWENKTGETRSWLDLPEDITLHMLNKVGVVDILRNVHMVCSPWRDISKHPCLFTRIMIPKPLQCFNSYQQFDSFIMTVMQKSCRQMIEFCALKYVGIRLLQTVSLQGDSLRYLKVDGMSYAYLQYFAECFSQLEHLDLSNILEDVEVADTIQKIGCSCPNLKHLRLRSISIIEDESRVNDVAFAIAKYAPRLLSIHLFNDKLGNKGLQAIFEGCPELTYIGLQKCLYVNIHDRDWLRHSSVLTNKIIDLRVYSEEKGNYECYLWTKDQ